MRHPKPPGFHDRYPRTDSHFRNDRQSITRPNVVPLGGRNTTNGFEECEVDMKTQRVSWWNWFQGHRQPGWSARWGVVALLLLGPGTPASAASFDSVLARDDAGSTVGDMSVENLGTSPTPVESTVLLTEESAVATDRGSLYSNAGQLESIGIINRWLGDAAPRWKVQAELLSLWQSNVPAVPLIVLDDPANPRTVLAADQMPTKMAPGILIGLILQVDDFHALETRWLDVENIQGARSFTGPAGYQLAWDNLAGIPVGQINSGVATATGTFRSLEVNWRRGNGTQSLTWLAGFRWVEWNQTLAINDTFDDGSIGTDVMNTRTVNDLYGGQLGLDALLLTLSDRIRFNGVAKAGIYGNPNAMATTTVGGDRIPPATFSATSSQVGFFGDIGVNGTIRLTNHILWRAGYNFFWISGVALPPQQLAKVNAAATPPTGKIDTGGSVFLQGWDSGIEIWW